MLESKAEHVDHHIRAATLVSHHVAEDVAQLVYRQVRRVEDDVGDGTNRQHLLTLLVDAFGHRPIWRERMWPPRLAEAANKSGAIGFEEDQFGVDAGNAAKLAVD